MPLILSLALAAQTVTLDADPVKGPLTCGYAVSASGGENPDMMLLSAQVSYYAMHAARADPQGKPFFSRVGEIAGSMASVSGVVGNQAAAFLPLCDKRFPLARSTAPVKLPQDPFERDMMCLSLTSVMVGAAEGAKEDGNPGPLARFQPLMNTYAERLGDERVKAAGITDNDAMGVALGKSAMASLDIGNAMTISDACEANLKA